MLDQRILPPPLGRFPTPRWPSSGRTRQRPAQTSTESSLLLLQDRITSFYHLVLLSTLPPSLALPSAVKKNDDGRAVAGNRSIDCSRPNSPWISFVLCRVVTVGARKSKVALTRMV
uniref:(northern house mosquito) hypothetical protein n=1 Tax=Culex pipiens TaxID=7175 RepID=A0A8D8MLU7_CULPI